MTRGFLPIVLSCVLTAGSMPLAFAATSEPQLNFKIYSPEGVTTTPSKEEAAPAEKDTAAAEAAVETKDNKAETKDADKTSETKEAAAEGDQLKKEVPTMSPTKAAADTDTAPTSLALPAETAPSTSAFDTSSGEAKSDTKAAADAASTDAPKSEKKVLQGYIRVVPVGTKVPIIMDTAVDSDTSQEGDEFAARTSEDLTIDGSIIVPAGSVIKGRIASLNAPKHLNRSGSVALKFDTVTTPDNRQIPLVANLVARGGVVHARRGLKDIAMDTGVVALPTLFGAGIGLLAGKTVKATTTIVNGKPVTSNSSSGSKITKPEAAMIGLGVGVAVGVAILLAKKGKKVDVRPGDELKIELAEDLRMPMM